MVRKFVTATVSAALCMMTVAPGVAVAQEYRFAGFDAPRGAAATLNFRVPIGGDGSQRSNYGLTFGYGQEMGTRNLDGTTMSRGVSVADLRFSGTELRQARVASFDLANLDQDERVSNLAGDDSTMWVVAGLVGVGVVVCLFVCFDDDEDEDDDPQVNPL